MLDQKTSQRITVLGFLMTCMIVIFHTEVVWDPINAADAAIVESLDHLISMGSTLAMDYFFLVTGLLLFHALSFQNYHKKIKSRIGSLLIPYVIWQLLTVIYLIYRGEQWTVLKFLRTSFLFDWPADGPLWYVYAVFLMSLLAPLQLLLFQNAKAGFWGTAAFTIGIVPLLGRIPLVNQITEHGYLGLVIRYLPSYLMGTFYGFYCSTERKPEDIRYYVYILMLAFLADGIFAGSTDRIIHAGAPLLLLYFFPVTEKMGSSRIYHWSFLLYAAHVPMMAFVQGKAMEYISRFFSWSSLISITCRISCLAVMMTAVGILYEVLKRFAPGVLGLLTGGRGLRSQNIGAAHTAAEDGTRRN